MDATQALGDQRPDDRQLSVYEGLATCRTKTVPAAGSPAPAGPVHGEPCSTLWRVLEKAPALRYQTAADANADLLRHLERLRTASSAVSQADPPRQTVRPILGA